METKYSNFRKGLIAHLDGFFHPECEEDLLALVHKAINQKRTIRVCGSSHSVSKSIYTTDYLKKEPRGLHRGINIMLDQYYGVVFDQTNTTVTVKAGTHLSINPNDPTGTSTIENGLLWQLDRMGWALPDLGGITHQTISGFMVNGCAGGSLKHNFLDAVVGIRYIDGTGTIRDLKKPEGHDPENEFWAVGVSMGLMGIISTVTLKCVESFNIIGTQPVTYLDQCSVNLFGGDLPAQNGNPAKTGLLKFLRETEYTRIEWWPQCHVNIVDVWQARRMIPADHPTLNFSNLPYQEFGNHPVFMQKLGGLLYAIVGNMPQSGILSKICNLLAQVFLPPMIRLFNSVDQSPEDSKKAWAEIEALSKALEAYPVKGDVHYNTMLKQFNKKLTSYTPIVFWDSWWEGLPMDNVLVDSLMPVGFMEIWMPVEDCDKIMQDIQALFKIKGFDATGFFAFEFYASTPSDFWMSMGYQRESFRVDAYWFGKNNTDPSVSFFPQFWDLLSKYKFRAHWGKYLPNSDWRSPHTNDNPFAGMNFHEYSRAQYPMWDNFMKLRQERDPDNIFLNDYWKSHLGL